MPRLIPLTCKRIEQKLVRLGFLLDHTDASSICYYTKVLDREELVVQVHRHPGDKGIDVIKNILRNGNISREEWLKV